MALSCKGFHLLFAIPEIKLHGGRPGNGAGFIFFVVTIDVKIKIIRHFVVGVIDRGFPHKMTVNTVSECCDLLCAAFPPASLQATLQDSVYSSASARRFPWTPHLHHVPASEQLLDSLLLTVESVYFPHTLSGHSALFL